MSIRRYRKISGKRSSQKCTTSRASASCALNHLLWIPGNHFGVPRSVVGHVRCPQKVCWIQAEGGGLLIVSLRPTEDNLFRCVKCGAGVTNVDAVLDAARIGQQALDKATSLQFKGKHGPRCKLY